MRLGESPVWTDPDRRQSLNTSRQPAVMPPRYEYFERHGRLCWAAQDPAQKYLKETLCRIEDLVNIDRVQIALRSGNSSRPGYSFDRFMYGQAEDAAQPTIIFDCESRTYRRNAKRILMDEGMRVERRGIGLQFYKQGPVLSASSAAADYLTHVHGTSKERTLRSIFHQSLGLLIRTDSMLCTLGGVLSVNGALFGLTVGHAFPVTNAATGNGSACPQPTVLCLCSGSLASWNSKQNGRSSLQK